MNAQCPPTAATNLTLSDPRCVAAADCCKAFKKAHAASQEAVSYSQQFEYGHWATWYSAVWIFVFALLHGWDLARGRRPPARGKSAPGAWDRCVARARAGAYRRPAGRLADRLGLPSCGLLAFLGLAVLFLLVLTFAVHPYYREHRGYGSPPLAVRTGLMAAAGTPLLVALSGKANLVSFLTGLGHERLNVVHRWVGWMCLGLSVAHTIPFIRAPLHDGGYAALRKQFYKPGAFEVSPVPDHHGSDTC